MAGVIFPLVSVQHQYLITDTIEGVTSACRRCAIRTVSLIGKKEVGGW